MSPCPFPDQGDVINGMVITIKKLGEAEMDRDSKISDVIKAIDVARQNLDAAVKGDKWKLEILSDVSILGRQAISLSHLLHLMLEQYKYSKDWSDEQLAFVFKRLILMMGHIDAGVQHSNYDYLNPKANDREGNRYMGNSLDDLKTIRRGIHYCERYLAEPDKVKKLIKECKTFLFADRLKFLIGDAKEFVNNTLSKAKNGVFMPPNLDKWNRPLVSNSNRDHFILVKGRRVKWCRIEIQENIEDPFKNDMTTAPPFNQHQWRSVIDNYPKSDSHGNFIGIEKC